MLNRLKAAAKRLKREVLTLYCLVRDPRTPPLARGLAVLVVGYALSPVDLIPDFIPVLGLLDDLILVPLGVWLVLRLIPENLQARARLEAAGLEHKPISLGGLAFMLIVWGLGLAWIAHLLRFW